MVLYQVLRYLLALFVRYLFVHTYCVAGEGCAGGDSSPKRGVTREGMTGSQGVKKDSIRGCHPKNLMHHGNKVQCSTLD